MGGVEVEVGKEGGVEFEMVKTDLNWERRMLALLWESLKSFPWDLRGETPVLSLFRALT